MAPIRVPKPPKTAYNPDRTPGTLLQNQLQHLEWAARPAAERGPDKFAFVPAQTEAEAAARIERLMADLHRKTVGRPPLVAGKANTATKRARRARPVSKATPRRRRPR